MTEIYTKEEVNKLLKMERAKTLNFLMKYTDAMVRHLGQAAMEGLKTMQGEDSPYYRDITKILEDWVETEPGVLEDVYQP